MRPAFYYTSILKKKKCYRLISWTSIDLSKSNCNYILPGHRHIYLQVKRFEMLHTVLLVALASTKIFTKQSIFEK